MSYTPRMSEKDIEKRALWHEKVYTQLKDASPNYRLSILGHKLKLKSTVFAPHWGDSIHLAHMVANNVRAGQHILDLGTGSGIQGIIAATNGAVVTAVDNNPAAVQCAQENADANGVGKLFAAYESDLFSGVTGQFDVIIFNPPFRWFAPRDDYERGETDESYQTLIAFFRNAKKYLKSSGSVLLVFSDSGDIVFLEELIQKYHYKSNVLLDVKGEEGWRYKVYELKLR